MCGLLEGCVASVMGIDFSSTYQVLQSFNGGFLCMVIFGHKSEVETTNCMYMFFHKSKLASGFFLNL